MTKIPPIKDQSLLLQALTHRSYINEHPDLQHNERLEFLGDAILGFVVGELLYQRYPQLSEAALTRLRAKLVNTRQLAIIANDLNLDHHIRLAKGADKEGGRQNPSLLCNVFEALIGAYYLDQGIRAVQDYLKPLFEPILETLCLKTGENFPTELVDVKNRLQQWSLAQFGLIPEYHLVAETGRDHEKEFTFEVRINGRFYGQGKGRKKQEATQAAAQMALNIIASRSSNL